MRAHALIALCIFAATGCSSSETTDATRTSGGADAAVPDVGNGGSPDGGSLIDASGGGLDGSDAALPPGIATLHGKVLAPEGTIPISGALVYLTKTTPPAIPDRLYCDQCIQLDASTPYALTRADGTFDMPAYSAGSYQLVVQKGQFRRIRPIDVVAGDIGVPTDATTLPKATNAALGDTIPRMAIVNEAWDSIDVSLARLGLGTEVPGFLGMSTVDRATAPFDYWDGLPGAKGGYQDLLGNPAVMAKYNIIFLPCSWSDGTTCDANTQYPAGDPNVQSALQQFVSRGGKLYVTDYSYEFVRQPFPGYVTWENQSASLGSACLQGSWDGAASSPDQGLTDWLAAQGITSFDVEQSWTAIDHVSPVASTDTMGNPVTVTPKVWVEAQSNYGVKPATVSFEQQCGRVLFSTYHTEGANMTLSPQERALLYVLLEVSVCVAPPDVH